MWRLALIAALPGMALADSLVATRTIRAQTVIAAGDVSVADEAVPGALSRPDEAIGLEARVSIYAGRPIRREDLSAPAMVERNQLVTLGYSRGGLQIRAEGRALGRGAVGETIRVMNLASRTTVTGRIGPDGTVLVGPTP